MVSSPWAIHAATGTVTRLSEMLESINCLRSPCDDMHDEVVARSRWIGQSRQVGRAGTAMCAGRKSSCWRRPRTFDLRMLYDIRIASASYLCLSNDLRVVHYSQQARHHPVTRESGNKPLHMKIPISQHVAESSVVVVSQLSAAMGMWAAQVPGEHRITAHGADGVHGAAALDILSTSLY